MPKIDIGLMITAANNATGALKGVQNELKGVGETAKSTENRLKAIQVVIAGIVVEKLTEFGRKLIEVSDTVQNAEVRMSRWTGGLKQAESIIEGLNDKLGQSGIDIDTLGNAFIRLRSVGVSIKDATETVYNLVSGLESVGGDNVESALNNAATAFQRFIGKGYISTRDLNAIVQQTGITVKELADAAGVSITQFYVLLRNRVEGSKVLLDAFNKAAQEKFGGFVQLLGSTIGGALNKFKTDFELSLGAIGSHTSLNAQIVAVVRNLDTAMKDFIGHISSDDINHFFKVLSDMVPVAESLGRLILLVGKAVLTVAEAASSLLNILPPESLEFGIIGYALFGKKGALLIGLLGTAATKVGELGAQVKVVAGQYNNLKTTSDGVMSSRYQTVLDALNKKNPNSPIGNAFSAAAYWAGAQFGNLETWLTPGIDKVTDKIKAATGLGAHGKPVVQKVFGDPEQIKAIQKEFEQLTAKMAKNTGITPTPGNPNLDNAIRSALTQYNVAISEVKAKDAVLNANTAGDTLLAKINGLKATTTQWTAQLEEARKVIQNMAIPIDQREAKLKAIDDLEKKINKDTQAAIELATKLNELKNKQLVIQQQIAQVNANEELRSLKFQNAQANNPLDAMLGGTSGGQFANQIQAQHAKLEATLLGYQEKVTEIDQKILSNAGNPELVAQLQKTKAIYGDLINQSQEALKSMNAAAQLSIKLFQDIGNTLSNDLSDGLAGVISGTETWADVGRKVFQDMTQLAVKYLEQLIEIQLFQNTMGGGLGGGGGILGALLGFANGGVFQGNVKPFANGDIVTGPTLFGLAGEAGTEAIMPLTRIGGKLGVRAENGSMGGNHYTINVSAIDTQSGLEFVSKHIEAIDQGLSHGRLLNRSTMGRF